MGITADKMLSSSKKETGLSVIEAVVAIAIFIGGLIPAINLAILSQDISVRITDNLIAAHLAQEGIEVVRSLRDGNWFLREPYDDRLVGTWRVEWNTDWRLNPPQSVISDNPSLKIDNDGVYNYSTGTDTKFRREIAIEEVVPDIELKVTSEVYWPLRKGGDRPGCKPRFDCVKVEAHLFDWE